MAARFHKLKIKSVAAAPADSRLIEFEVPPPLAAAYRFIQGQYLTVRARIGGEEVRRSYSLCDAAGGALRVLVKGVAGGVFSAYCREKLRPGSALDVMTPQGRFFTPLNPARRKRYFALAAGSGITPVLSLLKTTLAAEPRSSFSLLYASPDARGILFRDELLDLKDAYLTRLQVVHILSREKTDNPLFCGRINAAKCRIFFTRLFPPAAMDEFFLCGPPPLIKLAQTELIRHGAARANIHRELFISPDTRRSNKPQPRTGGDKKSAAPFCQAQITAYGATTAAAVRRGETILEAAKAAGLDLPYSCQGGVCGTCRALLRRGRVTMQNNYALAPEETAAGFILCCQARPRSAAVAVDFDAA